MPASSAEVIGAVLQSAYRHPSASLSTHPAQRPAKAPGTLSDQLTVCGKQVLGNTVEYESAGRQQVLILDSLKTKYVTLTSAATAPHQAPGTPAMAQAHPKQGQGAKEDQLEEPQVTLWPRDKVTLGWRKTFPPGAGMVNLGNTCYLNSSLQALFHIPALANWLLEELQSHTQRCEANNTNASFCSVCAMMRTLRATLDRSTPVIKPALIQHKLKCIGKTLMYGRQEDAHEFIKLLLDHMEKSYLCFRRASKLDHRSKETTPLNQIFGGYLRQQVICPLCRFVSTTFSHFQDLVLDIRSVNSVDDALNLHFRKETLDSENAYRCEKCHRKVPATKRHLIERAPHVLLIQLKRFTMNGGKIGKHINIQRMIDISRFVNGCGGGKQGGGGGGPYQYRLTSMVIHLGGSQHGGHYTAVAEASNGSMFEFDDSSVRSISLQSALLRNPYILFYELVRRTKDQQGGVKQVLRQSSEKALIRQNSDGVTASGKPLPTSHSASSVTNGYHHQNHQPQHPSVDTGGGAGKVSLPPPLPCHKDRERLSFALKSTQGRMVDSSASRPNKIILNNSSTSLLGTKNSTSSSTPSSNSSSASSSTPKSSTFPHVKSSSSSSSSSSLVAKSSVLNSSSSSSSSSSKPGLSSSSSSVKSSSLPPSSSSSSSSSSKPNTSKPSTSSTSSTKGTVPSLVPYLDDSEDSEADECRRGAKDKTNGRMNGVKCTKERMSGTAQRVTNGEAKDGDPGARNGGLVPRVILGSAKGKAESGWQVTDAAHHSPSESSSGSASGARAFTVVEQPLSATRPDPDAQGWTVTEVQESQKQQNRQPQPTQKQPNQPQPRRPRPELEKSLSHDCVLPGAKAEAGRSEGDSASLRSKASVDSGRSDRSTKSMKRSIFSLFTCVSSTRSPETPTSPPTPPTPPPNHRGAETATGVPHSTSTSTTTATTLKNGDAVPVHDSTSSANSSTSTDKSKRTRDQEEQEEPEPSSPSKKSCQGKAFKDTTNDGAKNGLIEGQSLPTSSTSTTSTTTTSTASTTAATSTTTTTVPKNGLATPSSTERKPKNYHKTDSESPKNGSRLKNGTHNHNGTSTNTTTSSTSSLSSSSDSDTEEEEEGSEQWVEKTKETMGSARLHPAPSVVEWNGTGQRREKGQKEGMWNGTRSSAVVDELRRAGNSAYGSEVNSWSGGRSVLDQEAERMRREAKKRNVDDLYNEEMDAGRNKKTKAQKKGSGGGWGAGGASQGPPPPPHTPWATTTTTTTNNNNNNPFQRLQDTRINNNNSATWNNNNNNKNNHNRFNNHNYNSNHNHHYFHHDSHRHSNGGGGGGGGGGNAYHHHHHHNHHHSQPYNRGWRRNSNGGGKPKFHNRKYGGKEKYHGKHGW
ncbi:ubiquitin carboxyl-terminal hydrolase 36-like [Eriocheir sinensis]|uniref:ubiquitin carboxyl-terminal hydrolase 36-like n=1 Tax=Eriocheir sinensis TaxID=95602 RepID=UPI0021C6AB38|nr:ubiquitin carboxyl-terminal hydrolase 36-like [Eriocheir sinensis]